MDLDQFNSYKILHHREVIEKLNARKNPYPVSCEIDPSNLCNHNCVWCYFGDSRKIKKTNLEKTVFLKLIDDLAAIKLKSITFTGGGEPLVNPVTIEAIEMAYRKGINVGLVTNGGLLTEEKNKVIVSCCDFVRISLDAGNIDAHRITHLPKNLKKDNFARIIENINRLACLRKELKRDITIGVGFLVHKDNYSSLFLLAKQLKSIGVDYLQVRPVFIPDNPGLTKAWSLAKNQIKNTVKLSDDKFHVFPVNQRYQDIINKEKKYKHCHIHNLLSIVGAEGNVYMCSLFRGDERFSFGNLHKQSFVEIWNGKRRQEVIESLEIGRCPSCRYNKYNEIMEYLLKKDAPHADFL